MHNQQLTEILHPKMTSIMDINDNYNNRLEREVTALKRENILLETQNTQLAHDLKRAQEIIKERNEMLEDNTYEKRLEDMISMLGSEVIKKETTIWERNALLIIVTSLSAIALTYLIFVL
jgi:cell shape-determining protein MreC